MSAFQFQFESILRYRKSRRDLCLQLLAQVLADDRELSRQRDALAQGQQWQIAELRDMSQAGAINVDAVTARRYYVSQLGSEMLLVDHNRRLVARQIELCQKALARAEQDVKVLEKLRDRQSAEHRYHLERREGRELDETWQAIQLQERAR